MITCLLTCLFSQCNLHTVFNYIGHRVERKSDLMAGMNMYEYQIISTIEMVHLCTNLIPITNLCTNVINSM